MLVKGKLKREFIVLETETTEKSLNAFLYDIDLGDCKNNPNW